MIVAAIFFLTAAPPSVELPRNVTMLGTARAEIVQAERASRVVGDTSRQHLVRREGERITVYFN